MFPPRNFYCTFLGFSLSASEPTGKCGVSPTYKQLPVMDYTVTPRSVQRVCRATGISRLFRWLLFKATRGFLVLFWRLVFRVTASIKERNPADPSKLNSSLEIWNGGPGGGYICTARAKTENSNLYCHSCFGYFLLSNIKHVFNWNNAEMSHRTAFPKPCTTGSLMFHEMLVFVLWKGSTRNKKKRMYIFIKSEFIIFVTV